MFIRRHWVHSGSHCGSFGSSGFAGFTCVRLGCVWVYISRVVRFTRILMVGFIRDRWVHSGSPLGSLGSSWFVGFTQVRYCGHWGHPGSLDFLALALGVVGFILGRWVH